MSVIRRSCFKLYPALAAALVGVCLAPSLQAQEAAATPGASASAPLSATVPPVPVPSAPTAEDPAGYRVAVGDELNFRFFYMPSLNTVAVVRPDGKLALPLAGELQVDGLTMGELSALVEKLLAAQVRRPQVTITCRAWARAACSSVARSRGLGCNLSWAP